jgi:drug/metabolite transporter (DMT)-like permease
VARARSPIVVGTGLAIAAAVLFGATTPWLQRAEKGVGPFSTAALLYAGAAAVAVLTRRRSDREAPLVLAHAPRIVGIALLGAVIAPVALAWGLARASGAVASLLLNLEGAFTVLLGVLLYREHVGRRVALAATCIGAGGALLLVRGGLAGGLDPALAAVALATLAWAGDNAVARPLSVVAAKGAVGATLSLGLALAFGEPAPRLASAVALAACGATGYGLSLRFYMLAQRRLGAGRTASVFGIAPFFGAILAGALGEPLGGTTTGLAAALMALGTWLHLRESHEHAHRHEPIEHEHAHRHDDGHHEHVHAPMPVGEHSHVHRHEPIEHAHPHAPDVHHRHAHDGHGHGHGNGNGDGGSA